ncbi:MAG: class I SAM-dependent methyltransferase, partial [Thermoanaerobaculia bacterium]
MQSYLEDQIRFYLHLRSWSARAGFAGHQVAGRIGLPEPLRRFLRRGVDGIFASPAMTLALRPNTWDAWTAHPGHERETHEYIGEGFHGGVMVDVGAYCGSFCLRYRAQFEQILAIEASSENFRALTKNIELSRAEGSVIALHAAAAAKSGTTRLFIATADTQSLVVSGPSESV